MFRRNTVSPVSLFSFGPTLSFSGLFRWIRGLVLLVPLLTMTTQTAFAFGFQDAVIQAKQLASQSYVPEPRIPEALSQIDQNTFERIAIKPSASLWQTARFGIDPIAAGYVYDQPVDLYEVTPDAVAPIPFNKTQFDWPSPAFAQSVPANLGFAGFSVHYPLSGRMRVM